MKRVAVCLAGAVLLSVALSGIAYAAEKFAYLDLSLAFKEYNKTKEYDKALTGKENAYTTEREAKVNEIKKLQDKLNLLSEKEKEAKKSELESKTKALQDFDRQKQTDLRKEQEDMMGEIFKDIEKAVKDHAEKEGISLVFNDRLLVYQNKSMDITSKVIEILNKSYKK